MRGTHALKKHYLINGKNIHGNMHKSGITYIYTAYNTKKMSSTLLKETTPALHTYTHTHTKKNFLMLKVQFKLA
jgi:hypothetical protein